MEIQHVLNGPVAFDSETTFSSAQHFVKGCSYSVSAWVWLWPARAHSLTILRTKALGDHAGFENNVEKSRHLYPTILSNLPRAPNELFFGISIDKEGNPIGFFSGEDIFIPTMEWFHVAMTIKDNKFYAYVNGVQVDVLMTGDFAPSAEKCPYFTVPQEGDQDIRTLNSFPYVNNTAMQVMSGVGKPSTPGIVQDVMVVRGVGLDTEHVQLMMNLRKPVAFPTLSHLVKSHYRVTDCNIKTAMEADCKLHAGIPVPLQLSDFPPKSCSSSVSTTFHRSNAAKSKKRLSNMQRMEKWGSENYRDKGNDGGSTKSGGSFSGPMSDMRLMLLDGYQQLVRFWNALVEPQKVGKHVAVPETELYVSGEVLHAETVPPLVYQTGSCLSGIKQSMGDGDDMMYRTFLKNNNRIRDELYTSARLWMNGRHCGIAEDTKLSMHQWRERYVEMSQSALILDLFVTDDYYYLNEAEKMDVSWPFLYASRDSHKLHLLLGYRMGFDLRQSVNIMSRDSLVTALNKLADSNAHALRIQNEQEAVQALVEKLKALESITAADLRALGIDVDYIVDQSEELVQLEDLDLEQVEFDVEFMAPAESNISMQVALVVRDALVTSFSPVKDHSIMVDSIKPTSVSEVPGLDSNSARLEKSISTMGLPASYASVVKTDGLHTTPQEQCSEALIYYTPVSQYIASHFNMGNSGISMLEEVDIRVPRSTVGHTGEDDELHVWKERDASNGDPSADIWLARRYYFGLGGVERNADMALRHFRRAAERGLAEGLYNVGFFYDNGDAGLETNPVLALEYFQKAADHAHPFGMALEAVGNYHLGYKNVLPVNVDKAKFYFEKAANLNSPEGHYALAMIYLEKRRGVREANALVGATSNVPQAMVHLAHAVSGGHRNAQNVLISGIFEADSWLHKYGREERKEELSTYFQNLTDTVGAVRMPHAIDAKHVYYASKQNQHKQQEAMLEQKNSHHFASERWAYVPGQSFEIRLHGQDPMYLSLPLDESHARHGMSPCTVALQLAKTLSQSSHYTNGVMRNALNAFLEGDLYAALEFYDEAAELGVQIAHYNSIYLYEELMKKECGDVVEMEWWNALESMMEEWGAEDSNYASRFSIGGYQNKMGFSNQQQCKRYFQRVLSRRYIHLSNVVADPVATREIASQLLEYRYPFDDVDGVDPHRASASASSRPSVEQAVRLYAYNAMQGDVQSLVSLGWAFQSGSIAGIPRNLTAAKSIFAAARAIELELGSGNRISAAMQTSPSTMGVAPLLGEFYVTSQMWMESYVNWDSVSKEQSMLLSQEAQGVSLDADSVIIVGLTSLFCFILGLWVLWRRR